MIRVLVADDHALVRSGLRLLLDAEADREAVLARFVSGLSGADTELLRRLLGNRLDLSPEAGTDSAGLGLPLRREAGRVDT